LTQEQREILEKYKARILSGASQFTEAEWNELRAAIPRLQYIVLTDDSEQDAD
jgi:hypothetical protein